MMEREGFSVKKNILSRVWMVDLFLTRIPLCRWSAFVIWRPSGALSVYVVKLDRRVVERKEFQGRNSMQLLNITKTVV